MMYLCIIDIVNVLLTMYMYVLACFAIVSFYIT